MALTPFHLQVAGILIVVAVGVAALWWLTRALGWHSGRALYWLNEPRDDDVADEDDNDDGEGEAR